MSNSEMIEQLRNAIVNGDEGAAAKAASSALVVGVDPLKLIKKAINEPLDEVGKAFQDGELFLPELIMAGDAARVASDVIMPHISMEDRESTTRGTVVIGSIQGDLHDIGKNIVAAYMSAGGLKVHDLGTDVSPKQFIEAAREANANIIAVSTLLTTTLPHFRELTRILQDTGRRDKSYMLIGGGPVTPEWAAEIGADGYGRNAKDAVDLCNQLLDGGQTPPLDEPLVLGALKR